MNKEIDGLFTGYALEPCIDIKQAYVKNLFKPSILLRLISAFSKGHPAIKINTVVGKFEIDIALDKISQIIVEDSNSKRVLKDFLEQKLLKMAENSRYFIGIKDDKRYGEYFPSLKKYNLDTSYSFPNPRPLFHKATDSGGLVGSVIIVDAILNSMDRIASFNQSISQAVSGFDSSVKYILSDYPFWMMSDINSYVPIRFSNFMLERLAILKKIQWHPFVRVLGILKQQGGNYYLDAGMIFTRASLPYNEIENWVVEQHTLSHLESTLNKQNPEESTKDIRNRFNEIMKKDYFSKENIDSTKIQNSLNWRKTLKKEEREGVSSFLCLQYPT